MNNRIALTLFDAHGSITVHADDETAVNAFLDRVAARRAAGDRTICRIPWPTPDGELVGLDLCTVTRIVIQDQRLAPGERSRVHLPGVEA